MRVVKMPVFANIKLIAIKDTLKFNSIAMQSSVITLLSCEFLLKTKGHSAFLVCCILP